MCWLLQSAQFWPYPTFLLVPLIAIGIIECFAGYRAWRFLLGLNGAVLGLVAGVVLSMMLGSPVLILLGAFGGSIACAVLFVVVRPVGSFVFAFGSVASWTLCLIDVLELPSAWIIPLCGTAGFAGGAVAAGGHRAFMIGMTGVAGAQQVAAAWRAYRLPHGAFPLPEIVTASEAATLITLAAAGLLVQFLFQSSKPVERALTVPHPATTGEVSADSGRVPEGRTAVESSPGTPSGPMIPAS